MFFYLGLTAVLFACLCVEDTVRRLATIKSAYILSGVLASILGSLGYFQLYFPIYKGLEIFAMNERAVAGFKDPNVLGVFLIPPLMWVIAGLVVEKIRITHVIAAIIMMVGLLLAFSRGAWASFGFACAVMLFLLFFAYPDRRTRRRIVAVVIAGCIVGAGVGALLLSVEVVQKMFQQRSSIQAYDIGSVGSRFNLQENSLKEILDTRSGWVRGASAKSTAWCPTTHFSGPCSIMVGSVGLRISRRFC